MRGGALQSSVVPGSPELELLLSCARAELRPHDAPRIRELLPIVDEGLLLGLAERHGLGPLAYWHLSQHAPEAAFLAALKPRFDENARRSLRLTSELLRLLRSLRDHGVPALPYKGPLLAEELYGNLALREFCDLDLLLRPADIPAARDLLLEMGYEPAIEVPPEREAEYLRSGCELAFAAPGGVAVELHWQIAPRQFSLDLDLEAMWQRLRTARIAEEEVSALAAEDQLLVLAVHGVKHLWSRLQWLVDVAESLRRHDLDWAALQERAQALGARRVLHLALLLAHDLLDAPVPAAVRQAVAADRELPALAALVRQHLAGSGDPEGRELARHRFILRTRERRRDRARYLLRYAFIPGVQDWMALRLPAPLAPLYPVVRLVRLFRKFGELAGSSRAQ